ncbi:MAG: patatin-like phospholipase family protein [Thermodesulfobacteriota bacterium]|nr:patatin-like phospholipase family protein [Thermodesulfobacteriota bacterium]
MFDKAKLGLALGAGGARGLAHIGALKALERAGVRISFLAGSSIGAVIGAAYAVSGNAAELEQRLADFMTTDLLAQAGLPKLRQTLNRQPETLSQRLETWLKKAYFQAKIVTRSAVLDSETFKGMIEYFIPQVNIQDLPIPFRAVGTDIKSGRAVVFSRGSLQDAVYASAAIPGVVNPLPVKDLLVVDGGVVNMVPVLPLRHMGADTVLAVDVQKSIAGENNYNSALDLFFRVEEVQSYCLKEIQLRRADLVLRPQVGHIHWSEFERASEMIRLGRDETVRRLDSILELAGRRKRPWWWLASAPPNPARDWIEV